ncbi:RimK family alpha-L-glutamate ligase [Streptomyces sp. NPDC085612]|uniref:RimK family alpha-L-glutamate ligase n=1 Tax=Streptomyces sp. NPDC085612 TaxID=3365732 RepID=UPI0037D3C162
MRAAGVGAEAARVAVVTSTVGEHEDADLPLIVEGLLAAGLDARAVAWDAADAQWERYDLAVIRSTWDYAGRLEEFLGWTDAAARVTRLWNPAATVRWNSDKRYLLELAARGVPVVPTRFVEPGAPWAEEDFEAGRAVVVKPSVSAGARDTARYEPGQLADAARHVRMLQEQGRTAMVQPYLRRVEEGERALVFFGGAFSHAIRKGPLLTEPGVVDNARVAHPGVAPYRPTAAELDTARAALAAVPGPDGPLFARVDLALGAEGEPVVMELELIEPNLFLGTDPHGLGRLVAAVTAAVAGEPGKPGEAEESERPAEPGEPVEAVAGEATA